MRPKTTDEEHVFQKKTREPKEVMNLFKKIRQKYLEQTRPKGFLGQAKNLAVEVEEKENEKYGYGLFLRAKIDKVVIKVCIRSQYHGRIDVYDRRTTYMVLYEEKDGNMEPAGGSSFEDLWHAEKRAHELVEEEDFHHALVTKGEEDMVIITQQGARELPFM